MNTDVRTARLHLRPFLHQDFEAVYSLLYADAAVARWWTGRSTARQDVLESFLSAPVWRLNAGFGFRAVVRTDDQALLGLMGFQKFSPDEDLSYVELPPEVRPIASDDARVDAELTYAFGRPYQRQGYATEAGQALLHHGFHDLGIARVVNIVDGSNAGTIALMKRLGFDIVPNLRARPDWPSVVGLLEAG